MTENHVRTIAILGLVALAAIPAHAQRSTLAQQVFAAESSFAATLANHDSAGFATFVATDAIFFGGREPSRGRSEVVASWIGFFRTPAAPFSWRPQTVEVLSSGTLALSSGPVFDPTGKQISVFNSIWRKDPDGRWRVVFDKGSPLCNCQAPPDSAGR